MMSKNENDSLLASAPLGKKSSYINTYTPSLLFALPRKLKRDELEVGEILPFTGIDFWTGFEISWLNLKGKPIVALAEFRIPANSRCLIESKSFKLYLNGFNHSRFDSLEQVCSLMISDLSKYTESSVEVKLYELNRAPNKIGNLSGTCLDSLDVECTEYQPQPSYLSCFSERMEETVHTHLLKSNCLITGQPDWGSVEISYKGQKIDHSGLLKYIVSLRNHNEFHEQCVERIFIDIMKKCHPDELTVYARYTRRGGLDISPFRTNKLVPGNIVVDRLIRQ